VKVLTASPEAIAKTETSLPEILSHADPLAPGKALDILESGGLVVAPTETRYGLLGRADNPRTLEKLFETKQRPAELVTAVFVASVSEIESWGGVTPTARMLQERFLPGPLTLVMLATDKARQILSSQVIRNGEIGIRVSDSVFIKRLLQRAPFPVTATSANLSGSETYADLNRIAELLGGSVALYVDGGILDGAVSTVVRCGSDNVEILRAGALAGAAIQAALGNEIEVIGHD